MTKILDKFKEFNYMYYNSCDKLQEEYEKMYAIIKSNGHVLQSEAWSLDAGILLENENSVIAGSFFNLSKNKNSILIHIIYVDENFRKQGIYKKMHALINQIGLEQNRKYVYSYIHTDNKPMQDYIIKKIGYEPIMSLVRKSIV
jgi:predicted GNAT family acetyltransferase